MEKLKMHTPDFTDENIAKLAALFPNCVTESRDENGNPKRVIDFDLLKQELSGAIVEGRQERYHLDWVGKREALLTANAPIAKTLRPSRAESVDFDTTKNLYIEGDNLDALKLLQETYLGKVKMIYIDPPYNTGNDFIYEDDFAESADAYFERSMQKDENGNRLVANAESNGRFHSDWLSMMYPRLKLARNLLTDDGVIFISIDDNEQANLKRLCDEVFGEDNFLANVIWERSFAPVSLKKHFSENHDFVICYAKSLNDAVCNGLQRSSEAIERYQNPDNDPRGVWQSDNLSVAPVVAEKLYPIITPNGREILPPSGRCWVYTKPRLEEMIKDNRIWFGSDGGNVPRVKRFLSEVKNTVTPFTIWKYTEVGHSQDATQNLKKIFEGTAYFDFPKPVNLVKRCLELYSTNSSDIILDFFSGSATTAHAVMQLNAEDGGNRQFIMVQLPEATDEKSEAFKAGYKTIAEIGKERIRRAGRKIKAESPLTTENLDIGFRVLKVNTSNMKDVYYAPDRIEQGSLLDSISNVKEDRTDEDLLFQILLDWGVDLSVSIAKETISGKTLWVVDETAVLACFETGIDENFVKELAARQPLRAVFRDAGFADDNAKINVEQIFKLMSPGTEVKTI